MSKFQVGDRVAYSYYNNDARWGSDHAIGEGPKGQLGVVEKKTPLGTVNMVVWAYLVRFDGFVNRASRWWLLENMLEEERGPW